MKTFQKFLITGGIALLAVAVANRVPTLGNIVNGN